MQKQKFNPETHSVSLHFGQHIVHGHAQESVFGDVMQTLLMREIERSTKEAMEQFSGIATAPPTIECETKDTSSILNALKQWQEIINSQEPQKEFEPCSVPDWMRPSLKAKGMTEEEIDKILITGIEPSWEDRPGVVFRTVTI
ncbi:hypothetical protein HOT49_gp238 [Erwinia phage vB_EamM_Alexandra]|uniref:Uncharacterized protein n=1 Tax=Erwinia phage vB_EamM_Alexandra TaxID=2201424 RepID=A0A2Z4QE05_9CAUD|nr:hypothetical protein HOT49_gp238 [Erwinia phage vB_EamM_Alexandra]AWY08500.1 hypothetical protein Alexandra_240 [Erwinia phage vB_EamM_Alexandra]